MSITDVIDGAVICVVAGECLDSEAVEVVPWHVAVCVVLCRWEQRERPGMVADAGLQRRSLR